MSNYYYENGANHYDHHKEVTVNITSANDAKSIFREILADDIEDADCEEMGDENMAAERQYASRQSAYAASRPSRPEARRSGGGRKPDSLFNDESITGEWAKKFNTFLKRYNKTGHRKINSQKDNYINKAMVAFLLYWKRHKLLTIEEGNFKGRACFKFLTDRCGKESEVSIDTYNKFFIDCMRNDKYKEECKDLNVEDKITAFCF